MKILVIEDDKKTSEFLLKALKEAGYTTILASDGRTGLMTARTETFDLAIIDLMLPLVDGFTIIESIRREQISENIGDLHFRLQKAFVIKQTHRGHGEGLGHGIAVAAGIGGHMALQPDVALPVAFRDEIYIQTGLQRPVVVTDLCQRHSGDLLV